MFQSFTGSSRRPRQVNLSGRNANPWSTASSTAGSPAAVANAQQEREKRQRDREQYQAATIIQKSWRASARRRINKQNIRHEFVSQDLVQTDTTDVQYQSVQLERLLLFFDYRKEADFQYFRAFLDRHVEDMRNGRIDPLGGPWPMLYLRLQNVVLAALRRLLLLSNATGLAERIDTLLDALRVSTKYRQPQTSYALMQYYTVLQKTVLSSLERQTFPAEVIIDLLTVPLESSSVDLDLTYEAFAQVYLTVFDILVEPYTNLVLPAIAHRIDISRLSQSTLKVTTSATANKSTCLSTAEARLALLANYLYSHGISATKQQDEKTTMSKYVHIVTVLLGSIAEDFDVVPNEKNQSLDGSPSTSRRRYVDNEFCRTRLLDLTQESRLEKVLGDTSLDIQRETNAPKQLAIFALTLLRFFPQSGDEIRFRLFRGLSSSSLSVIRLFYQGCSTTQIFKAISLDPRATVDLIRDSSLLKHISLGSGSVSSTIKDEWKVVLVFCELYSFILRLMDDDEFFSASLQDGTVSTSSDASTLQRNALPLHQVRDLTIFLKNLGFAMYFYYGEISRENERSAQSSQTGLSTYFRSQSELNTSSTTKVEPVVEEQSLCVHGIPGMTIDYVKGLVTGLLRMLYERDSRRKFLPSDHWLLTSRSLMDGFTKTAAAEEQERNRVAMHDDETDEEEDLLGPDANIIGQGRARHARAQLRLRRQQINASRRRYLQAVAPRLEILQNMPFVIPFQTRVQIFRGFVAVDMAKRRHGLTDADQWRNLMMSMQDGDTRLAPYSARIRRGHEFEDAFEQLGALKDNIKEPVQISFVDKFGQIEAGIDGGGVTKEFLTSVTQEAFMSGNAETIRMFSENENHLLFPNPSAVLAQEEHLRTLGIPKNSAESKAGVTDLLRRYEFLGRVVGKCLYEGILVDIHFAGFFLRKWALTGGEGSGRGESGYRANVNDLIDLDEGLYDGLLKLKRYTGDVEDFALDFTIIDTLELPGGETRTITKSLKSDGRGAETPVTNDNRLIYIASVAQHRLVSQPYYQTMAFLRGLSSIIQPSWLSMFNQSELQTLIGGTAASISIADLRANTLYGGVYQIGDDGLLHPTVDLFWRVMEKFEDQERRAVLKFVTSTPNAPLLGFGSLNPRFSIRDSGDDQSRLPSTSTCVNLLKLPRYVNEQTMKDRLLYAAFSGAGFDLS